MCLETLQELKLALVEEWNNTEQNVIRHLVPGIPRRIHALLEVRGDNTLTLVDHCLLCITYIFYFYLTSKNLFPQVIYDLLAN